MSELETSQAPQEAIGRLSDPLELLAEMGRDFAASQNINRALNRGLIRIVDYLDAEAGSVFLLDDTGTTLRCDACVGPVDISGITLSVDQGIVGRCVRTNVGEIVRDVAADPSFNRTVDQKTGFTTHSILSAPMSVKEQRIGAIQLLNKRSGDRRFATSDLALLESLSTSAALALLNARMATALVEQERLRRELELAAEIQRSLLPEGQDAGFPVHGINHPARAVSGDFYDFFALPDGRVCFCVGDVSGKGINAALLMSKTAGLYRYLGKAVDSPGRLLGILNGEICETATRGMFITMVCGILDPPNNRVILANAGHEPPLRHRPDGSFESWPADAPPLGIAPDLVPGGIYPETELRLDGGTLYVFTDGLTEARVPSLGDLTIQGVRDLISANQALPAPERLAAIVGFVERDSIELHDDLTILAIDVTGNSMQPEYQALEEVHGGTQMVGIRFEAKPEELKQVRAVVRDAAAGLGFDEETIQDCVLAVDEACQNIIRHAYVGGGGEIDLKIRRDGNSAVFLLRDFADTIDRQSIKPRDLDDLRPGGLGTHFMREMMDEVVYLSPPEGRGNLLKMVKIIK